MKALGQFIQQRNAFNKMFGNKELTLTDAQDRQRIADIIDSTLSPENLTCDGELPRSEINRRYRELMAVAKELKALDPNVKFYEVA
jgi:hypothetical protein